ncbi:MAG: ATP-binding protein [Egibacteraceae bacterium]
MIPDRVRQALTAIADGAAANTLESDTLEFKTKGRSVPDTLQDLAEAAACLANARGGVVVVGVADARAGEDAFVGCDLDPLRTQRRLYELTDPHLTVTVETTEWDTHSLLVVTVPPSPEVHAVAGRSTERVGTSCEPMSPSRIATVVADRRGDDWSDEDSDVALDRVDPIAIGLVRRMLGRSSDPQRRDYARRTDPDLLRTLGVVTQRGTLAYAGALLLSSRLDVGDQLSYIHRRTPAGALAVNEHLSVPLLPALQRTFDLIEARLDRTSVNLPGGQQLQLADLPEAAVREAIVNGVMHRDYRRRGPVQVDHTATRLVVTSPGPFVSGVTKDNVLTTSSRSRNATLSRAIRTLGLAETAGTGVDRMYVEMAKVGHQPPAFSADQDQVQVTLVGGAPNTALARYTATLPAGEAEDADTMLVLLTLLTRRTVNASVMAPLLQKPERETLTVLDRLASEPVHLLERTRESTRRASPVFRLREHAVAALRSALAYRRRTTDEYDRKIMGLVREAGEVNARMVKLMLDLDTAPTSRVLADLVERQILIKTSQAQRGPGVKYGPGPRFPKQRKRRSTNAAPEGDKG